MRLASFRDVRGRTVRWNGSYGSHGRLESKFFSNSVEIWLFFCVFETTEEELPVSVVWSAWRHFRWQTVGCVEWCCMEGGWRMENRFDRQRRSRSLKARKNPSHVRILCVLEWNTSNEVIVPFETLRANDHSWAGFRVVQRKILGELGKCAAEMDGQEDSDANVV